MILHVLWQPVVGFNQRLLKTNTVPTPLYRKHKGDNKSDIIFLILCV